MNDISSLMNLMGSGRGGIKKACKASGIAGVLADIINAQRLNTKQLAAAHDVDIEINMMTEDRAAELIADAVNQDLADFAVVFDDILDDQDAVLQEAMDDEYQSFAVKREKALPRIGEPELYEDDETDADGADADANEDEMPEPVEDDDADETEE